MKIDTLPFLHYMVRLGTGKNSRLVSPFEVEDKATTGGCFVAPVQEDVPCFPLTVSISRSTLGAEILSKNATESVFSAALPCHYRLNGKTMFC